jgi:lactobin A/cerein 7B family class IIb bacteriocin
MKKLELQNFGVQELGTREMRETDGGFSPWVIAAGIGAAYATIYAVGYAAGVTVAYVEKGLEKIK